MSNDLYSFPQSAWEKARSLVVGYIDEEEQEEQKEGKKEQQEEEALGLALGKKLRISVTGKSLLLPSRKGSLGGDPLVRLEYIRFDLIRFDFRIHASMLHERKSGPRRCHKH